MGIQAAFMKVNPFQGVCYRHEFWSWFKILFVQHLSYCSGFCTDFIALRLYYENVCSTSWFLILRLCFILQWGWFLRCSFLQENREDIIQLCSLCCGLLIILADRKLSCWSCFCQHYGVCKLLWQNESFCSRRKSLLIQVSKVWKKK